MGQIAPSPYSQTIRNCKEWLIDQMVVGDFDRLEKWAERNPMKFNNGNWKALNLGRNNPIHQDRLAGKQFCKKRLEVLVDKKSNMTQ